MTIIKVYKSNCQPCQDLSKVLDEVKQDIEFELEEYNIESSKFIERRTGKSYLMQFATTNIPLLLFKDEDKVYAAHYYEEGPATVEIIKEKLNVISKTGEE